MDASRSSEKSATEKARDMIFTLLDRKGSSQSDFASYLGITRYVVSQWRRGISSSFTGAEYLNKIAAYFGVSVDYLLGTNEKDKSPKVFSDLSPNEIQLVKRFRKLPSSGQDMILRAAAVSDSKEKKEQ